MTYSRTGAGPAVLLACALTAMTLGLLACASGGDGMAAPAAPATVAPPGAPPSSTPDATSRDAAASLAFLEGDGAALLEVHATAVELADGDPTAAACTLTVEELDAAIPMTGAAGLTAAVADDVLRTALFSERTALAAALTACVSEASGISVDERDHLAEAAAMVSARLRELEARR